MSRYKELEKAVLTGHRLSRGLLPMERIRMIREVLRLAQEETGATFEEVTVILDEALNRMDVKAIIRRDKEAEWLAAFKAWVLGDRPGVDKMGFHFVPVNLCQRWATEKRLPFEPILDALKSEDGFGSWPDEQSGIRYSKRVRVHGDVLRCYGFSNDWMAKEKDAAE